jgi:hypothetical protein
MLHCYGMSECYEWSHNVTLSLMSRITQVSCQDPTLVAPKGPFIGWLDGYLPTPVSRSPSLGLGIQKLPTKANQGGQGGRLPL